MRTHCYRITGSGALGETSREASGDSDIRSDGAGTVLTANLDQPALQGVLNRLGQFGLQLVQVCRHRDEP
jgi:hypothetical protein